MSQGNIGLEGKRIGPSWEFLKQESGIDKRFNKLCILNQSVNGTSDVDGFAVAFGSPFDQILFNSRIVVTMN